MSNSKLINGPPSSTDIRVSVTDGYYRAQQTTLVEDTERMSIRPRSSEERNRCLLTVLKGPQQGEVLRPSGDESTMGRSPDVDLHIPDPGLSRVHARLFRKFTDAKTEYFIEDCRSTNGTFVDGRRIDAAERLADGARIGLGRRTLLRFTLQDELEERAILRVHESAMRDHLTGAFNRGVFDERLGSEFAFSKRHNSYLSVLLLDVDHFKQFNDTHGHLAGDAVLRAVAESVSGMLRAEDLFARYGGEEFAVIARTRLSSAEQLAERIRLAIHRLTIPWNGTQLRVTVSIGVACTGRGRIADSAEALIQWADDALYVAKRTGRNRVMTEFDVRTPES